MLRGGGIALAGLIGAWDVARILLAGGREPNSFDLLTCPIIPAMQVLGGSMLSNVSDSALATILVIANALTYAFAAYLVLILAEREKRAIIRASTINLWNKAAHFLRIPQRGQNGLSS